MYRGDKTGMTSELRAILLILSAAAFLFYFVLLRGKSVRILLFRAPIERRMYNNAYYLV
mgnify:CR=1 FL=1